MATYYISLHDLYLRLFAQPVADEEQSDYPTVYSNNLQLEVERKARNRLVERRKLDARSTSCPAIATRRCASRRRNR